LCRRCTSATTLGQLTARARPVTLAPNNAIMSPAQCFAGLGGWCDGRSALFCLDPRHACCADHGAVAVSRVVIATTGRRDACFVLAGELSWLEFRLSLISKPSMDRMALRYRARGIMSSPVRQSPPPAMSTVMALLTSLSAHRAGP